MNETLDQQEFDALWKENEVALTATRIALEYTHERMDTMPVAYENARESYIIARNIQARLEILKLENNF